MKGFLSFMLRLVVEAYVATTRHPPFRLKPNEVPPTPVVIAVVSTTALGDTLLSTPVLQSARASWPNAILILVVHPRYRSLFEGLPGVDHLLCYDGSYGRLFASAFHLRKLRPEAVLLAHSNGPQDIPLAVFSGARLILKPATSSPFRRFLSKELPPSREHVINSRLALVATLGGKATQTSMLVPPRYASSPPEEIPRLATPVIGFQLGAANTYKIWPAERFGELAARLLAWKPGLTIVLTGTAKESDLAQVVVTHCNDARVQDHCGGYSVESLPWLLRQLAMLVTNDTGTMHLAIALGIPTVSLFGLTSSAAIGPFQDLPLHRVVQASELDEQHLTKKERSNRAMLSISTDAVFELVTRHFAHLYPDAHPPAHRSIA